jgi:hypothetical protein
MMQSTNWIYAILIFSGSFVGGAMMDRLAPNAVMAANHAPTQTARQFELVDASGSRRAVMRVSPSGTAYLAMYDGHGRDRAEFHVAKEGGASVGFYDQNGSQRVLLGEAPGGRNGLAIYSNGGRQIASLSVAQDNQASLTLYDPNTGRARAGLGAAASGSPALVLFDEAGRDRVEMHVNPNGNPGLALADENGKSVAGLPERGKLAER